MPKIISKKDKKDHNDPFQSISINKGRQVI